MKFFAVQCISFLLKVYFSIRFGNKITWGKGVILNHRFRFKGPGRLIIGDRVNLWAHKEANEFFTYAPEAVIVIGSASRLNGVSIHCRKAITVGEECLVGSAILMDNDFHSIHFEKRNNPAFIKSAPIHIGNRVWLGGQCAILKGVTVGEESVVGFRAVVTKDVPNKKIVAGNPAQIVKDIM